jgi:hypothetical protein
MGMLTLSLSSWSEPSTVVGVPEDLLWIRYGSSSRYADARLPADVDVAFFVAVFFVAVFFAAVFLAVVFVAAVFFAAVFFAAVARADAVARPPLAAAAAFGET